MANDTHELDLPLHSNINSIRVTHYNLELTCDIQNEIFYGNVVLVLIPMNAPSVNLSDAETVKRADALEIVQINSSSRCEELSEANERQTASEYFETTHTKVSHKEKSSVYQEEAEERNNILQTQEGEKEDARQDTVTNSYYKTESDDCSFKLARTSVEQNTLSSRCKDTVQPRNGSERNIPSKTLELSDKSFIELSEGTSFTKETCAAPDFEMVLDSWDLHVISVEEINVLDSSNCDINELCKADKRKLKELFDKCDKTPIMFISEKTFLKFWKPGIKHAQHFPECIRISYQTTPCGSSLKWTKDQDGRPCVFTHGHWINNRSLFPSQDVPGALATWQAYIHVPEHMTVLMSGDQNPEIRSTQDLKTYIYQTNLVVPSSTLALAVGCWTEVEIIPCITPSSSQRQLPCRLFTPKIHQYLASNLIGSYIPKCMEAAFSILGCHPFMRLDILIVPASFSSLGMASPSLLFLSQSVLSNDGHMLIRVAHEISHSWFGLAIGPRDWHEEWLSEGFCTYTESVIHARANQMTHEEFIEEREIYDHLKRRVLEAEVETISCDLQTLRNSRGGNENGLESADDVLKNEAKSGSNGDNCVNKDENSVKYVNNGMNPDKGFMQLHYLKVCVPESLESLLKLHVFRMEDVYLLNLSGSNWLLYLIHRSASTTVLYFSLIKPLSRILLNLQGRPGMKLEGYFLLRFLEDLVGHTVFLDFLKNLVETFHHTLIDSMDVLRLFFNKFPDKRSPTVSEDTIFRDWLNSPGLPQISRNGFESNKLITEVSALESQVIECNQIWTKLHWRKRRKVDVACFLKTPKLRVVQVLLFLDIVLDKNKIHPEILYHLNEKFGLSQSNADVRHKWCELVVKYRLEENYNDVRDFLIQNQAMGVYLFGELIISRDGKQRKLAEECYTSICDDMEEGVKKVVQTMIFGN